MSIKHLVSLVAGLSLFILVSSVGCDSFQEEASKSSAQAHFEGEMEKWMSGQQQAPTASLSMRFATPISYDIKSIVGAKPNLFAGEGRQSTFPAFQINTVMVWESKARTPLETVEQINITWNPHEKKWYLDSATAGHW